MEKSRKMNKAILLVLLVLVVGLSIGFAAFTSNLTIKSSATVKPDATTFKIVFSTSNEESVGGSAVTDGKYASGGTFADGSTTLEGLKATFTEPGQTATWELYAYNDGAYDGFLNTVTLGKITCTPKEGTSADMVAAAANGIKLTVNVGDATYQTTTEGITGHNLNQEAGEKIKVTLTYQAGSAIADGDFDVSIGDIILGYDSVD